MSWREFFSKFLSKKKEIKPKESMITKKKENISLVLKLNQYPLAQNGIRNFLRL